MPKPTSRKQVETLTHEEAKRKNIPTAEYQSVMEEDDQSPVRVAYERRNRDLDPQLVWRGKDEQDRADLVVPAPPLFIQEKVHPKALIDDIAANSRNADPNSQPDLFADFNGLPDGNAKTEFYQHDANWSNRMILGDSLQVMTSLAEREGLRGKVQCIYVDPPYGIKFNSNFQWSTTSRDVKDGKAEHITREPEQVKAFRDTWRDGIHSYLTYLRDRLTVARDLLTESGSVFVQIGDENVHRVRAVMDEVFGEENFVSQIAYQTTTGATAEFLATVDNFILWFAKSKEDSPPKYRQPYIEKGESFTAGGQYSKLQLKNYLRRPMTTSERKNRQSIPDSARIYRHDTITSQSGGLSTSFLVAFEGKSFRSGRGFWKTSETGLLRLIRAGRVGSNANSLSYIRFVDDFPVTPVSSSWSDTLTGSFTEDKTYVVQTAAKVIQRCILMTTDPGDLVLDPTCGSGTTAYVAEQWGRRWITIDTSRVALALARARVMGARYPYYLLADSPEGRKKSGEWRVTSEEQETTHHSSRSTHHYNVRQGFVYERVPHVTLKSIANNAEIDVIWEKHEERLGLLRDQLSVASGQINTLEEWEIPRERPADWPLPTETLITAFWKARATRQREIDASIAAKADYEYLYDKPYEDNGKVRVAGPFTVESLSPHRCLGVDENDELIDNAAEGERGYGDRQDFAAMILENLRTAGVQQAHKDDRIVFSSLIPWPGEYICAEGWVDGDVWAGTRGQKPVTGGQKKKPRVTDHGTPATEKRTAMFIGPEFGTVSRPDLVAAVREAAEAGFDVLIACAFNYDARASELSNLGRIPILKAHMNADLHMADDLKNTGNGNMFVIFGEPDIEVASEEWLVDRTGRNIAPYDIFKLISGTDSLAEINGLDGKNLRLYAALSCRGEIWDDIADATCRVLSTDKRRGRTGKAIDRRISSVAWRCAGLAGGIGNLCHLMRKAGADTERDFRELVGRLCRDQQNDQRDDQVTLHSPLTTLRFCQVTIHGVDVFHPNTGDVRSDGPDGIACWFIDTDYNEESFFVRHAYFLGANDPYAALKTTLKADINQEAWATLHGDTSRPFPQPPSGRIAVKVINHLGDEVMKVFRV